jgi:hypothetical protein
VPEQSPFLTASRQWTFTDREGKSRTYEQSELTIDGEMQLFGLIARQAVKLRESGFDFAQAGQVLVDVPGGGTDVNIALAGSMLAEAASIMPSFISEAAAVLLSIFPVDEQGRRNQTYTDEVAFLRRTMHTADALEMLTTFLEQNDIERLKAPFQMALSTFQKIGTGTTASPAQSPSTGGSTSSSAPDTEGPGRLPDGSRGPRSTPR